jgi:hypothetical protein
MLDSRGAQVGAVVTALGGGAVAAFVGLFGANEMTILVAILLLSLVAVAVSWLQPRGKVPEGKAKDRVGDFKMPGQGPFRTGAPRDDESSSRRDSKP